MAIKGVPVLSRRKRVLLACTVCGGDYWTHLYRAGDSKFCGRACWSVRNPPPPRTCERCGKAITSRDKNARFCCRSCGRKSLVGPKATNWKGGKSILDERARLMPERRAWRQAVFARDGFRCVRCGDRGRLHAHHIKHWADFPAHRFDVSNGETLCVACHGKEHNRDFTKRRRKKCPQCGVVTRGRGVGGLCMSCGVTNAHRRASLSPGQTSLPFPTE